MFTPACIAASCVAESLGGGGPGATYTNTAFVATWGNDSTGELNDLFLPFASMTAALVALYGQTSGPTTVILESDISSDTDPGVDDATIGSLLSGGLTITSTNGTNWLYNTLNLGSTGGGSLTLDNVNLQEVQMEPSVNSGHFNAVTITGTSAQIEYLGLSASTSDPGDGSPGTDNSSANVFGNPGSNGDDIDVSFDPFGTAGNGGDGDSADASAGDGGGGSGGYYAWDVTLLGSLAVYNISGTGGNGGNGGSGGNAGQATGGNGGNGGNATDPEGSGNDGNGGNGGNGGSATANGGNGGSPGSGGDGSNIYAQSSVQLFYWNLAGGMTGSGGNGGNGGFNYPGWGGNGGSPAGGGGWGSSGNQGGFSASQGNYGSMSGNGNYGSVFWI
ncbi:MAG TPA: hypothetical protein VGM54_02130 [Chthoniobacter sp.]|jgi:hypothetical protein